MKHLSSLTLCLALILMLTPSQSFGTLKIKRSFKCSNGRTYDLLQEIEKKEKTYTWKTAALCNQRVLTRQTYYTKRFKKKSEDVTRCESEVPPDAIFCLNEYHKLNNQTGEGMKTVEIVHSELNENIQCKQDKTPKYSNKDCLKKTPSFCLRKYTAIEKGVTKTFEGVVLVDQSNSIPNNLHQQCINLALKNNKTTVTETELSEDGKAIWSAYKWPKFTQCLKPAIEHCQSSDTIKELDQKNFGCLYSISTRKTKNGHQLDRTSCGRAIKKIHRDFTSLPEPTLVPKEKPTTLQ